jgi:acyl carrier protein
VEDRIKQVMSDVFNIDVNSINNDASTSNTESWDSLKHMNLIIALEEEFNIEFTDEEIIDSMNYALILNIIEAK